MFDYVFFLMLDGIMFHVEWRFMFNSMFYECVFMYTDDSFKGGFLC